ncbi:MAG: hypothetical protein ACKPBU_13590, partial [Alphaproteobacteria bacterium]
AYLFALRFVVRRGLALRARKLLAGVIDRARSALGETSAVERERVRAATTRLSQRLDELASLEPDWRAELSRSGPPA